MEWYDNGKKKEAGQFSNGKESGIWTYYNEDGTVDGTEEYQFPMIIGNYKQFLSVLLFLISISFAREISLKNYAKQTSLNFRHDHGGSDQYYYVESIGAGVCVFDYDGDGILDVYFPQGAPLPGWNKKTPLENKLYRNDGKKWIDVTQDAGVGDRGYGMGCACGDYDNDGAIDLYVTNFGKDIFYRNNKDGTFTDITDEVGIDLSLIHI